MKKDKVISLFESHGYKQTNIVPLKNVSTNCNNSFENDMAQITNNTIENIENIGTVSIYFRYKPGRASDPIQNDWSESYYELIFDIENKLKEINWVSKDGSPLSKKLKQFILYE